MTTAVVSGGTRGIGRALSLRLAALGHRVIALYRGDGPAAEQTERAGAGRITALRCDLTRPDEIHAVSARITGEYGAPSVLVNNAGVNRDRSFLSMTAEDWDTVLATNLSGPFHLSRALAPVMVEAGGGSIVNIASTTAIRPRSNGANYCASKAGLIQLTKCLALELAPHIRVNALLPTDRSTCSDVRTRPCSSHAYQELLMPASAATSARRSPGVRRRGEPGSPTSAGASRSRRERRNAPNSRSGPLAPPPLMLPPPRTADYLPGGVRHAPRV